MPLHSKKLTTSTARQRFSAVLRFSRQTRPLLKRPQKGELAFQEIIVSGMNVACKAAVANGARSGLLGPAGSFVLSAASYSSSALRRFLAPFDRLLCQWVTSVAALVAPSSTHLAVPRM